MADEQPIIIKKIKKGGDHGHHGGAWKIAYADFVTAMMAFFLLMWLLSATSEEQKRGIANYFDPITIGERMGGGSGVMMGESLSSKDASAQSSMGAVTIKASRPVSEGSEGDTDQEHEKTAASKDDLGGDGEEDMKTHLSKAQAVAASTRELFEATNAEIRQERIDEQRYMDALMEEEALFNDIQRNIQDMMENDPELKEMLKNLLIEDTPEGLRIQILDQDKTSMFPSGSAEMYPYTRKLLEHVARIIQSAPNRISISGHTDANPYSTRRYTNWELSTDRANASRRVLEESGIKGERFSAVIGKEAQDPFIKDDPLSPQNRRISITLLRQTPLKPLLDESKSSTPLEKSVTAPSVDT